MVKNKNELQGKTITELRSMIVNFKKELLNLRLQQSSKELTKSHKIRYTRRSIARINTFLNKQNKITKEESNAKARVKRKSGK